MTKRLSFLLLDANIIIELWRLGLWSKSPRDRGALGGRVGFGELTVGKVELFPVNKIPISLGRLGMQRCEKTRLLVLGLLLSSL